MNFLRRINDYGYVLGVAIITLALLFSTNLPVTGRSQPQEGISQPQAFTSGGTMNFQGQLSDMGGTPLNGFYNMRFAIYNSTSGGTKNWPATDYEQHTDVRVSNGLFSVQLGSIGTAISPSVFNTLGNVGSRYLQIWVCSTSGTGCTTFDDMGRLPISSAAYANQLTGPLTLTSSSQYAIFGLASDFTAINYGVYGATNSANGYGIFGLANNATGGNIGVYGETASSSGYGVFGRGPSSGGTGIVGVGFAGVVGETSSSGFGVVGINYGSLGAAIRGDANNTGLAGQFIGNVHTTKDMNVSGTLTKSAGSFKIDHPLDPENKYLYHSFVESPDMKNIYDGVVILDENGEALVTMPEWFEALNQEFRYQLTAIGAAMPNLYVSQKMKGNSFGIAGGVPGMEVSWQVTGIRHDPYAEENRIPIEENKPQNEIGTFLYPQGYGFSEEFGVNYNR